MEPLTPGAAELVTILLSPGRSAQGALRALTAREGAGEVRVLDLVLVRAEEDGTVSGVELMEAADLDPAGVELSHHGLIGDEDIAELAASLPPGSAALAAVVVPRWRELLHDALDAYGARLVGSVHVPLHVVNETIDILERME